MNTLQLWMLGVPLERAYGWYRVAPLYLLCGIFGMGVSTVLLPGVVTVGASPNVFGLLGAVWGELGINYLCAGCAVRRGRLVSLSLFSALLLVFGFTPWVDNFSHVTGFCTGLVMGVALQARGRPGRPSTLARQDSTAVGDVVVDPVGGRGSASTRAGAAQVTAAADRCELSASGLVSGARRLGRVLWHANRDLNRRQRRARLSAIVLLLATSVAFIAIGARLRSIGTGQRGVEDALFIDYCHPCSVLNCLPVPWWDCSFMEATLADTFAQVADQSDAGTNQTDASALR